jgi:hypothetical protein
MKLWYKTICEYIGHLGKVRREIRFYLWQGFFKESQFSLPLRDHDPVNML